MGATRWSARNRKLHHKRVPYLLDAKAILAAAAKGRTSARAIVGILRSAGAHVLAADILPKHVYVPSEDMPADDASRRVRIPRRCYVYRIRRRTKASRVGSSMERIIRHKCDIALALKEAGHLPSSDEDTVSDLSL